MAFKVEYLEIANRDIEEAVEYLVSTLDAVTAAENLLEELDSTVRTICDFPFAYQHYSTSRPLRDEIRWAPVKNYILYYTVKKDVIEIRRFLHRRRDRQNIDYSD